MVYELQYCLSFKYSETNLELMHFLYLVKLQWMKDDSTIIPKGWSKLYFQYMQCSNGHAIRLEQN